MLKISEIKTSIYKLRHKIAISKSVEQLLVAPTGIIKYVSIYLFKYIRFVNLLSEICCFDWLTDWSLNLSIRTKKGNTNKKGQIPCTLVQGKLIKHGKISYSIASRNGLNQDTSKAEALKVPQKVRAMLVLYFLSGIRILVCSRTGCVTSKTYLCLEDNRSSFSRVSLKFQTKDALL